MYFLLNRFEHFIKIIFSFKIINILFSFIFPLLQLFQHLLCHFSVINLLHSHIIVNILVQLSLIFQSRWNNVVIQFKVCSVKLNYVKSGKILTRHLPPISNQYWLFCGYVIFMHHYIHSTYNTQQIDKVNVYNLWL